jgi:diguanylate cyclase (GGDEF)-like protein/PAS domain S-box-containing protein
LGVEDTTAAAQGWTGAGKFLAALLERRMRWFPWLALVIGLASAIGAGFWMERQVEQKARAELALRAKDLADELASRIRAYGDVTYSIRALMDQQGAQRVDREQFHRFVGGLAIPARYPGLKNISFAYHVPHAARPAFEQRMRLEWRDAPPGLPPFELKPPGERAAYDVVSYIEPVPGNAVVIGLDLSGDAVRSEVIRSARDSGMLATTEGLKLLGDGAAGEIGVLLRLAVYEGGGVPQTVESRRQTFIGVAGVSIRLAEMLDAAFPVDERQDMHVTVHDITVVETAPADAKSEPRLLFDSLDVSADGGPRPGASPAYTAIERIKAGNRTWELRAEPLAGFIEQRPERALPYATGTAIFLMTLLLFGLFNSLATAKAQGIALRRNVKTLEFHRRRLAETQEIANIGGWEWDFRQHRQIWSDRLYLLFGRAIGDPPEPTDEFFINRVVHPADAPRIRQALKRVVGGEPPVGLECRVILPHGEERIMSAVTRLETADDGERTRLVGTVRDITEDHRAAARERAQLLFIQTMMDAIPTPVFQKDPAGRFRACNDAWCQFVGKTRDTIIGGTLEEFLPGPHVELIREQDRALLARPAASAVEVRMPNASGELRELTVHKASYLADDGTIAGLVGVIFDITDRKHAEDRLEQTIALLDRRNRVARLQGEFAEVLQSCVTLDEAYEAVAKYLPRLLPGSAGVLYRIDAAHARGDRAVGWGPSAPGESTFAPNDCVAVRLGRSRCVADSAAELNCHHVATPPPRSYACLPLSAQGELIGLLHVQESAENAEPFDTETGWAALTSAGEHIGLALANLTLRETLREQATRDKLTGLYNRHYLNARFEQEFPRTQRKGAPLAVVMLDIDHFKRFNDTFGHAAGDHVLSELGKIIRGAGRKSDVACRYGGEEFLLFMPETPAEVALRRAEEIRETVKNVHLTWEGQALGAVTLSAGVAAYPGHGNDPGTLLRCADQALYRAKELGRDRVVLAPLHSTVSLHSSAR